MKLCGGGQEILHIVRAWMGSTAEENKERMDGDGQVPEKLAEGELWRTRQEERDGYSWANKNNR